MNVCVVVPYHDDGGSWRARALDFVTAHWRAKHADWRLAYGGHRGGPWSKGAAVDWLIRHNAVDAEVLVIADADVLVNPDIVSATVDRVVASESGWGMPHTFVNRLTRDDTEAVYATAKIPATFARYDRAPYRGMPGGGMIVATVETYRRAPLDPRFTEWGGEDDAWGRALETIAGPAAQATGEFLYHLWHPHAAPGLVLPARAESKALLARYVAAYRDREAMTALVDEIF